MEKNIQNIISLIKNKNDKEVQKHLTNLSVENRQECINYKDSNGDTLTHFTIKLSEKYRDKIKLLEEELSKLKETENSYNKITHMLINDFKGKRDSNNSGYSIFSEVE
jgi:hypothetical protein